MNRMRRVLVTGATGYVGGRLVPRLLDAGFSVRCLVRDAARLRGRDWARRVEVVEGDVLRSETVRSAMSCVEAAYYLIHSMRDTANFYQRDLEAARQFGAVAREVGVLRLLYLGGLGDPDSELSEHLRSRQETGAALREAGVPVTEFRAAVIVGAGSLSFEIIRYLAERLPVMVCPQWVYSRVQPIAIRDVLNYLIAALDAPDSTGRVIEIGGADEVTYGEMITGYAAVRGLRRLLIPVPVLTPRLSAYWVHWMTPIPASIARPLIQGLRNEVVVRDHSARRIFPDIAPMGYAEAVRRALDRLEQGQIETAWSDALTTSHRGDLPPVVLTSQEGMLAERRQRMVDASPETVYDVFSGMGGKRGWFYANWAWALRGGLDQLVGGVGLRRGRRHPDQLRPGDALDFWRVETAEPGHLVRLRAEMKVPGPAWLEFEARPEGGQTRLLQTAFFAPKGLWGLLYWYALYPIHALIFSGMIRQIARRAETRNLDAATRGQEDV